MFSFFARCNKQIHITWTLTDRFQIREWTRTKGGLVRTSEYCLILVERAQCKVNYPASFELWISTNRGNSFVEDFFFGDIRLAVVHGRPLLCATRSQFWGVVNLSHDIFTVYWTLTNGYPYMGMIWSHDVTPKIRGREIPLISGKFYKKEIRKKNWRQILKSGFHLICLRTLYSWVYTTTKDVCVYLYILQDMKTLDKIRIDIIVVYHAYQSCFQHFPHAVKLWFVSFPSTWQSFLASQTLGTTVDGRNPAPPGM